MRVAGLSSFRRFGDDTCVATYCNVVLPVLTYGHWATNLKGIKWDHRNEL